jgi:hypothetical protein
MKTTHVSALALIALALCNCSSESRPESDEAVSESESEVSQSFTGNLSASGTSWVTHTVTISGAGQLDINLN